MSDFSQADFDPTPQSCKPDFKPCRRAPDARVVSTGGGDLRDRQFEDVKCSKSWSVNSIARWQPTATGNPPAATLVARSVANFPPFLFPIIQRRHGDFGVFRAINIAPVRTGLPC